MKRGRGRGTGGKRNKGRGDEERGGEGRKEKGPGLPKFWPRTGPVKSYGPLPIYGARARCVVGSASYQIPRGSVVFSCACLTVAAPLMLMNAVAVARSSYQLRVACAVLSVVAEKSRNRRTGS